MFVELVLMAGGASTTWYAQVPFRWLAESAHDLAFDYWDRAGQKLERGRIRPDATLEIGTPRRRIFLECETGSQSIVSADPMNTGATWAKFRGYAQLITGSRGQHDTGSPYSVFNSAKLPKNPAAEASARSTAPLKSRGTLTARTSVRRRRRTVI